MEAVAVGVGVCVLLGILCDLERVLKGESYDIRMYKLLVRYYKQVFIFIKIKKRLIQILY